MNRKCYASKLGDCQGGMSREHYISDCMLSDNVIFYGGVKFAGRSIRKANAVGKNLCVFHNSGLSAYDSEAGLLLDAMNYPDKYEDFSKEQRDTHGAVVFEIDGDKFEKWLMKTTINHLFQNDSADYIGQAEACLDYLFKGKNFRYPNGLYGFQHGYKFTIQRKGFMLFPLYGINELCNGLLFFINDYPFVLLNNLHHGPIFVNWENDWTDKIFKEHVFYLEQLINSNKILYRPTTLDVHLDDLLHENLCSINFKWAQNKINPTYPCLRGYRVFSSSIPPCNQ
jgi:hypothetical protein